ncbi:MAG: DUF3185 family protein [Planctomycetota bacterium]
MRRISSIVLLVAAAVMLFYGLRASDSLASSIKETFDGTPTDQSMWLIIGGAVLGVVGLVGVLGGRSAPVRA